MMDSHILPEEEKIPTFAQLCESVEAGMKAAQALPTKIERQGFVQTKFREIFNALPGGSPR